MSPDATRWLAVLLDLRSTELARTVAASCLAAYVARMEARAEGRDEAEAVLQAFAALRRPVLTVVEGGVP